MTKISKFHKFDIRQEFDSIKEYSEDILWIGKPKMFPYFITGLAVPLAALVFFVFYYPIKKDAINAKGSTFYPGNIFVAVFIGFFVWAVARRIFSYKNTSYAFTNKRVMVRTGFIADDFKSIGHAYKSIDYYALSNIRVTKNFVERVFNAGTIKFLGGPQTGPQKNDQPFERWVAIPNPYEVFGRIKKVSVGR